MLISNQHQMKGKKMFELRFQGRCLARGSEMRMRAERIVTAQFHGRLTRDYEIVKVR